ncbi:hypothetical protein EYZ11_000631 [Aspergillus tanneri]|uniref:NB-ARC domain-containing protein n=1 Tax=Aspergillus tanneri TaxID=1220188 RepID=A0A4S3JX35_9EURO|nr:hypothetical protein EYZ11_000631 [Aspergillus tanneri]
MTDLASRVKQFGLTQVYCSPEKPQVDVVFVHGLNGHPYNTWATQSGMFWPADLLPEVLGTSRVRILTYGYNANVTAFTDGVSKDRILNHAETLASGLAANRNLRGCADRPIIFVCHSLGGLVVKRALIYCRNVSNEKIEHLRSVYVSTYGILFLGTPHNGSDVAKWGLLLQNICSAVLPRKFVETSPHLVKALRTNNETLQNINSLFAEIMGRFHIYFFHETLSTDVKGTREVIVDESSAAPYAEGVERMGIESDHRNMCKFEEDSSPGYEAVAEALLRYSRDAPHTIMDRWAEEEETRRVMKRTKVREIFNSERGDTPQMGGSEPDLRAIGRTHFLPETSPSVTLRDYEVEEPPEASYASSSTVPPGARLPPTGGRESPTSELAGSTANLALSRSIHKEPLFVVPPGFHPNATFVGMQKELEILHSRLFKAKKRSQRLVAVLISGVPGSGKSHLAREYVWSHRDSYSGGIFWVDAKSRESTCKCFWDIAQAAMLTDGEEFQTPGSKASQKYVEAVRNWFQGREEWLLVFDGLTFDNHDDLNNFKQFLPFNKQCSIIYTSVDRTLRKKQRLYEPYSLQMPPLQAEDACKLLFKDLGIKRPTREQLRKATEVVRHYECLPLAIHAISHRLSATAKPIERYHIDSHLTDEKLAEPFLSIMHDLYRTEHFEALSLINLLSFFGHDVPIGLINLGRASLEAWNVKILSSSRSGERGDIDTTLGVLIRYGLIERTSDAYALQAKALSPRSEKDDLLDLKAVVPELSESQTESSQDAFFSAYQSSGSIDLIKIHSVVQGFCRDELKIMDEERKRKGLTGDTSKSVAGFYDSWLVVATRLLCLSYENAKRRMDQTDNYGLVKDYREYETHASVLGDNFPRRTSTEPEIVCEARKELRDLMRSISNEIERISPSSSQESIRRHRSVFDRSSSSSSSIPESSPDEGLSRHFTWDLNDTQPVESPQEISISPPRFNLKPFLPHIFRDSHTEQETGYETDGEGAKAVIRTSPALSQFSQSTEKPISSQAHSPPQQQPSDDQGWHIVTRPKPSKERQSKSRPKFPRNIRRPKPAAPVLKVFPVEGRSASSSTLEKSRTSSLVSASEALSAVHNASPPQSSQDISRLMGGRPVINDENAPTYASVAARRAQETAISEKQRSSSTPGGKSRPTFLGLQSKSSGDSLSSAVHTSPFSTEFKPDRMSQSTYSEPEQGSLTHQLHELDLNTAQGSRYHSRHLSAVRTVGPIGDMSASTPSVLTYLPPLPYENNIEVSVSRRKSIPARPRPVSQTTTNISSLTHPSAIMPGASPPASVAAEVPAGGYASDPAPEPMSRGISSQSHQSWSTEPIRYPSRLSPMSSNAHATLPKAVPHVIPQQQALSGTGSWVGDMHPQSPPQPKLASSLQSDVSYSTQPHLRAFDPLNNHMASLDQNWEYHDPTPTLHFGAHRVDVREARQRLHQYRPSCLYVDEAAALLLNLYSMG